MKNHLFNTIKPRGLGDVVAAVAQPIAKAIDAVAGTNLKECGGCKKRREALNQKFPMKSIIIALSLLTLNAFALDWTYSTNLYNNLSSPTNIYMGTNSLDGTTNGDSFYQWGTKLNGLMLLYQRDIAKQDSTNSWLSSRAATNADNVALLLPMTNGITTNIPVLFGDGTTNTLYFTNGVLRRITP